jgi:gliding motility-associated protein GldM
LGASVSNVTPKMSSSKGGIKMEGGVGILEFTAQAGSYDAEGNSKQTWEGRISVPKADGTGDTTFTLKEDYIVAKPVIQVQSASVQALYLRCGNKLNIQVPALGVNYDPSFSATGAATERGSKKGEVIVVPNSANVALTVSSGGNTIGTENFKVRTVPKPSLAVAGLNLKQGGACPASLTVKAIADESFKAFLPEDARYRVTEVEVIHIRGRRPVGTKRGGGEININDFRANAREGDRLFIEVKKIQRMNYKGQVEDVAIATESGQFNYNITQ